MKGQASYPFSMIEAAFTFLLLMSVAYGGQSYTEDYLREETVDIRADRVERAALALEDYPGGVMEFDLESIEFKVESSEIHLQFDNSDEARDLSDLSYSSIDGPSEFESFDNFCLEKTFEKELKLREC